MDHSIKQCIIYRAHTRRISVYGQLADKPTRRQSKSPTNQIAEIDIVTLWFTPKCNGNYVSSAHLLDRFSLECRGGI